MTQVYVPTELSEWVEFIPGGVKLKENAPDKVKPLYNELKKRMEAAEESEIQINL